MWDSKTGEIYRIKGNKQKKGGKRSEDFISVLVVVRFLTSRRPSSLVPTFVFTLFFFFFPFSIFTWAWCCSVYKKTTLEKGARAKQKERCRFLSVFKGATGEASAWAKRLKNHLCIVACLSVRFLAGICRGAVKLPTSEVAVPFNYFFLIFNISDVIKFGSFF